MWILLVDFYFSLSSPLSLFSPRSIQLPHLPPVPSENRSPFGGWGRELLWLLPLFFFSFFCLLYPWIGCAEFFEIFQSFARIVAKAIDSPGRDAQLARYYNFLNTTSSKISSRTPAPPVEYCSKNLLSSPGEDAQLHVKSTAFIKKAVKMDTQRKALPCSINLKNMHLFRLFLEKLFIQWSSSMFLQIMNFLFQSISLTFCWCIERTQS